MARCTCGPRARVRRLLSVAGGGRVAVLLRYVRRLRLHYGFPRHGEPKTKFVPVRRRPCPLHPCRWIQLPLFADCPLPRRRLPAPPRPRPEREEWDDEDDEDDWHGA